MNNLIGRLWRTLLVRNEILLKSCTNDVHMCEATFSMVPEFTV